MSKHTATGVVRLPVRDVEAGRQDPSEPARVLDFAKLNAPDKSKAREKPPLARREKIRRIVDSAIEKLDDDQLEALITAIEEITGCHSGGDSENDGA